MLMPNVPAGKAPMAELLHKLIHRLYSFTYGLVPKPLLCLGMVLYACFQARDDSDLFCGEAIAVVLKGGGQEKFDVILFNLPAAL